MKKKIILLLVAVSSVMVVSAEGRNNKGNNKRAMPNNENRMEQMLKDAEVITLTGKLELVNGEPAKIVSDGVTYTVRAPWLELSQLELKNGQTATFEGVVTEAKLEWDGNNKNLILTKIIIDDKEIEINREHGRGKSKK